MDKIIIENLNLFACHGVNPEEKRDGQNFLLTMTCQIDLDTPSKTDDLNDTVSYAQIIKKARAAFCETSYDLIERAAAAVCDAIFENFPKIGEITLLLKKPEAPIKADFEYVAVEITRKRSR